MHFFLDKAKRKKRIDFYLKKKKENWQVHEKQPLLFNFFRSPNCASICLRANPRLYNKKERTLSLSYLFDGYTQNRERTKRQILVCVNTQTKKKTLFGRFANVSFFLNFQHIVAHERPHTCKNNNTINSFICFDKRDDDVGRKFCWESNTRKNYTNRDDERSTTRGSESRLLTGWLKIVGEIRSEGTLENGGREDTSATAYKNPGGLKAEKSNGAWARFFIYFFYCIDETFLHRVDSLSVSAHIAEFKWKMATLSD